MKIGLYNLEPNIVNSAMMRVSSYHKEIGNDVNIYNPFTKYDKIYAFSLFNFTDKGYIQSDMECGGSGFSITKKLPLDIESQDYDWSLYPNCDFSLVWFSIGCIRNCTFCIVRKKEGIIKSVKPKNLNPNGKYIKVMDNNFFANPIWETSIEELKDWRQPVDFQGVDLRIMNDKMYKALNSLKHYKQIKFAWDNPQDDILPKIKEMIKYIKPYKLMCYVLIGFNSTPEEDLFRIEELRKLKIDPFVMPYDKKDKYQKTFARWVNHKAIFKTVKWRDYKK